jgi:acetyl esterase/lipase
MTAFRSFPPIVLTLAIALLSGCSQAYFWAVNADAPESRVETAAYAPGAEHELDVYRIRATTPAPVVVFFYGGSWQSGRRQDYRFVAAALASHGVLAIVPDYRKSPQYPFPAFMQDAAAAVAWTKANAARYGGDPARIYVMGHSAGGQIAALLATDGHYLQAVGMKPCDLAGVIGLAGPYDFLPITDPKIKTVFGPEKDWPLSQPVNFVDGDEPPFLLLHGATDNKVWPMNSEHLAAKLRAQHEAVTLEIVPDTGHIGLINGFVSRRFSPALDDSLRWIDAGTHRAHP